MAKFPVKLRNFLSSKMESCKSVAPLFSDAMERELTFTERLRVKLHIWTCSACVNYISNLKFMQSVFRNQDEENAERQREASLSDDAKIRIKNAIRSAKNAVLLAVLVNTIV